jgi:hypothetical protein
MFHVMSNVFEQKPWLLMIFLSVPPYISMINVTWIDKVFFSRIIFLFLKHLSYSSFYMLEMGF